MVFAQCTLGRIAADTSCPVMPGARNGGADGRPQGKERDLVQATLEALQLRFGCPLPLLQIAFRPLRIIRKECLHSLGRRNGGGWAMG